MPHGAVRASTARPTHTTELRNTPCRGLERGVDPWRALYSAKNDLGCQVVENFLTLKPSEKTIAKIRKLLPSCQTPSN